MLQIWNPLQVARSLNRDCSRYWLWSRIYPPGPPPEVTEEAFFIDIARRQAFNSVLQLVPKIHRHVWEMGWIPAELDYMFKPGGQFFEKFERFCIKAAGDHIAWLYAPLDPAQQSPCPPGTLLLKEFFNTPQPEDNCLDLQPFQPYLHLDEGESQMPYITSLDEYYEAVTKSLDTSWTVFLQNVLSVLVGDCEDFPMNEDEEWNSVSELGSEVESDTESEDDASEEGVDEAQQEDAGEKKGEEQNELQCQVYIAEGDGEGEADMDLSD
ncbi:hypothetical protein BDZ91DRAFT_797807 [Kalaharituber pfeilii]|nr:hypothetical protein BDZ91DRAFT_797807 [Kalaharituber pfeilii]